MSNIDKQAGEGDVSPKTYYIHPMAFGSTKNPGYGHVAVVKAEEFEKLRAKLEAAEKRIADLPGQKRVIGWRMADYTDETADPALAKNWATAVDVLPIFEGDVNTKLSSAAAGKGE